MTLKLLVCFVLTVKAVEKFSISEPFDDYGGKENYAKIRNIFEKSSVLSILLKNYEQPDEVLKWFESIFGEGNKSYVIHAIKTYEYHDEWVERCVEYQSDPAKKTSYYERMYQRTNKNVERIHNLHSFDEVETENNSYKIAASSYKITQIQEVFANELDKWWKYYYGGYILFCPFYLVDYFIGCLVNRAGTFLIIIDENVKDENSESFMRQVNSTFYKTWKNSSCLKLHILINKTIFTFDPFERVASGVYGKVKVFEELWTEEDLKRINGYPLYVDIFWSAFSISTDNFTSLSLKKMEGPDIEVTRVIGEQMNATIVVIENNGKFGIKFQNGTLTGALGSLQRRKSDIAMTAFFMKDYETRATEFLYPLYMDKLCVVVPKAQRIPPELLPLMIFDEKLWIILFIVVFMICIVWILLRSVNNQIRRPSRAADNITFNIVNYNFSPFLASQSNLRQNTQIFIDTWMLFLSIPMRRLTRAQYERIFLASVCLVSIIFVSIYQSSLATVFVRPIYFKDIETLDQLDKSGNLILVKYAGYLTDVFPNDTSQVYRNLRDKMKLVDTELTAMDLVKYRSKTATITRKSTTLLDNYLYFMKKELYLIDKECPKNYFLSYMVPTKSVYLTRINEILFDILRFGFIWKWINDFNYKVQVANIKKIADENTSGAKVLTMNDLKFPFYALIAGCSLSLLAFIFEIFFTRLRRRKKYEV
ncbi:hypothetical protein PVAND_010784 [Polypedilum vanderplanki]|uniref:Ionotropic glutamate receptor C-terminal domain-containing protein n=1 Tax=Polypedilum vanderplanki TaxID=319348 RepID=A0A9J6CHW7_POLVA|nr:hypothetical protein PVAND_010784 [Polypedilum vanderplanki]